MEAVVPYAMPGMRINFNTSIRMNICNPSPPSPPHPPFKSCNSGWCVMVMRDGMAANY